MFLSKLTEKKRLVSGRIEKVAPKKKTALAQAREEERKQRKNRFFSSVRGKRFIDIVQNELILADISLKPEEFGVIWLLLASLPSGLIGLFTGQLISALTLAALGAVLPVIFLRSRKKKRTIAFETQLGDALVIICNCLRSGLTFQQAMEAINKEMEAPISVEFGRTLQEIQYGLSLEQALNNLSGRIKSSDLMLTVSAVNIQRQTGGNLSEILEIISETIKDRIKIKGDIRTLTAQGRISGLIVGVLPIALGSFLMVINPDYMKVLFTERMGHIFLMVAVVLEVTGFILIRKIVDIKY
ncbi:MAG TPA: type II secretion system F family protein [Clostridiales bacterium]|nr:type II secretion system F family protein [Clostridiales bacterium]